MKKGREGWPGNADCGAQLKKEAEGGTAPVPVVAVARLVMGLCWSCPELPGRGCVGETMTPGLFVPASSPAAHDDVIIITRWPPDNNRRSVDPAKPGELVKLPGDRWPRWGARWFNTFIAGVHRTEEAAAAAVAIDMGMIRGYIRSVTALVVVGCSEVIWGAGDDATTPGLVTWSAASLVTELFCTWLPWLPSRSRRSLALRFWNQILTFKATG